MAQLSTTTLFSDANLVSYYKLENTSDSKGANTLTNTGSVAFVSAKYGNGADLTATNSSKKLASGNNLGIAGTGAMSVTFWVKQYNTTDGGFFTHTSTTTADRYLIVKQDGAGNLQFNGAGVTGSVAFTDTTSFHHVVITRSGAGAMLGYLDGVQVASFSAGATGLTTDNFQIGAIDGGGGAEWGLAIIDDMGIFSRVLTAQEVQILYQDGFGLLASEI